MTRGLVVGLFLLLLGPGAQDPAPLRTFHINNEIACGDGAGWGATAEKPYCSVRYVSTWWKAGDLFLLHSKRDGSGPVEFTRSGTAAAPIVLRGVGTPKPVIGSFVDIDDTAFVPTDVPGVFKLPGAPAGVVWQTYYPDILVDDVNQSKFTMTAKDGPLQLVQAPDDATLAKIEGVYKQTLDGLFVHPYGSQPPSLTSSDFVVGTGRALNFTNSVTGIVFDHLMVTYAGSSYAAQFNGTRNIFRNMSWVGVPLSLRGTGHLVEHYTVSHVIFRDASGGWLWWEKGNGTAGQLFGYNHILRNGEVMHSWNAEISTEGAKGTVIENLRMHGSPNHCGAGREGNTTVRNWVAYNCQDYVWLRNPQGAILEHVVVGGSGINVEALTVPMGPVIMRNILTKGKITFVRGPLEYCTWEKGSVLENSIVDTSASIERCVGGTQVTVPFKEYQEQCAAGTLTGCMTIKNVKIIPETAWKTVIKDGMWSAALGDTWDVSLVPGSPALNLGASTTPFDILGVRRPQPTGGLADAGIFEVTEDKPTPVDCVMSDWGAWVPTSDWSYANWSQTRSEGRKRSVTTPPANGGAACPTDLTETRQVVEACTTITVTPSLTITCNVTAARKR